METVGIDVMHAIVRVCQASIDFSIGMQLRRNGPANKGQRWSGLMNSSDRIIEIPPENIWKNANYWKRYISVPFLKDGVQVIPDMLDAASQLKCRFASCLLLPPMEGLPRAAKAARGFFMATSQSVDSVCRQSPDAMYPFT